MDTNLKLMLYEGEEARVIRDFEDYIITSQGRVLSAKKKVHTTTLNNKTFECIIYRELSTSIVRGYKTVNLSQKGIRKKFYIHELVFNAFVGEYMKAYFKIKHIDGDKLNNRVGNLLLEFRRKDKKFIEKYYYQTRLIHCLND